MVNLNLGYKLVPNILYLELKCHARRAGYADPQVLCFKPRAPMTKHIDGDRYRFEPITDQVPSWIIPDIYLPGTFYLEGFDLPEGGDLFFTWDLAGQENYRPGEKINPATCTAPMPS